MKVTIDKNLCIGCGVCAALCPDIFELGPDNKSHVKDGDHSSSSECAKKAANACPVAAIHIEE